MKKHINKLFIGTLIASMSFLTPSCSSDYLDTAPTDSIRSNRCRRNNG